MITFEGHAEPQGRHAFLICTDDAYAPHAGTCLFSLLLSTTRRDFDLHVIANRLSATNIALFDRLARLFSANIRICEAAPRLRDLRQRMAAELHSALPHLNDSALLRLLYDELISPGYERIVYLDCDCVILQDASTLFDINISGHVLGATPDLIANHYQPKPTSPNSRHPYFNSGILLIDDRQWRQQCLGHLLRNQLQQAESKDLISMDQEILNRHFRQVGYQVLPYSVNCQAMATLSDLLLPPQLAIREARIVHFAGEIKPWQAWAPRAQAEWYELYRRPSPWGYGYQPEQPTSPRQLWLAAQTLRAQGRHQEALACSQALSRLQQTDGDSPAGGTSRDWAQT